MDAIPEGEAVELRGTARPLAAPLVAPLTGEPCIGHITRARVFTQLDFLGRFLGEVSTSGVVPFVVETAGGPVLVVDTPLLDLELTFLASTEGSHMVEFLAPTGLAEYVMSSFFEHGLLRAGDAVVISGVITLEPSPALETGFRDLPTRTRLIGYGPHRLRARVER